MSVDEDVFQLMSESNFALACAFPCSLVEPGPVAIGQWGFTAKQPGPVRKE